MNNFYRVIFVSLTLLFFSACQETNKSKPYIMNANSVNPNSLAYVSKDKALDRKNKLEMAKIVANSKIEVARVESKKAVEIAKIDSVTKKDITKQTSRTKEKQSMISLYMSIGLILAFLVGIYLWYKHKKKSLEIKVKLEENRLKHELMIKEKELNEQRIQKVLDLAISGQLPQELQKDFINALTQKGNNLIESK